MSQAGHRPGSIASSSSRRASVIAPAAADGTGRPAARSSSFSRLDHHPALARQAGFTIDRVRDRTGDFTPAHHPVPQIFAAVAGGSRNSWAPTAPRD
ncbi:hypothetical protein OHA19_42115 (plasmid) [Streptomyces sp. NBC_00012]|uniref:hypothetical protein n=1 Tax=unclassified Streptomyces TaxID=2593676 RepID=UPI00324FD63E